MSREVLQQALDALEGVLDDDKDVLKASISGGLYEVVDCQRAITAIRAELAKPELVAVSAECRFTDFPEWGKCTIEHHNMVQAGELDWEGYETRLLYALPATPSAPHPAPE